MTVPRSLLATFFSFLICVPTHANTLGANLVVNSGAEDSAGAPDYQTPIAPTGWNISGTFSAIGYVGTGSSSELDGNDSGAIAGGTNFFWGGTSALSTAQQSIDISALASQIDGGLAATLSAYLGGFQTQGDNLSISATFLDGSGTALGSMQIGPVAPSQRNFDTQLVFVKSVQTVPIGSRSVSITMTATRENGASNDGYADNLRFVLGNESVAASKTLTPKTSIENPPTIMIKGKSKATVVMQKFNKVDLKTARLVTAAAAKDSKNKLEISYSVTVAKQAATSKKDIKRQTSKKNQVTFLNLGPGNYTATYSVKAVQGKKVKIQTNVSPAQPFTVQ